MSEVNINSLVSKSLSLSSQSVQNTIKLLEGGATIPFIARYRKEATHSLDELQIGAIQKEWQNILELIKRKQYILQTIEEQGQLSESLKVRIENCWDEILLEDLYLPFKKKRQTKADIAKDKGLEPLAQLIMAQKLAANTKAKEFISEAVYSAEEALQGARDIIAEIINENTEARDIIRRNFKVNGFLSSKVITKKKGEGIKYKDYFDYEERASKAPAHRILAVLRAEKEGFLKVKVKIDDDKALGDLHKLFIRKEAHPECSSQIIKSIDDAYKRLLYPSIETEFRNIYKSKADEEAINVFSENLKQLLLSSPLGAKSVIGMDPGFRTGCKIVCLDENGFLKHHTTIYPHPPQNKWQEAQDELKSLASQYSIEAIAIGNGTAGKESFALAKSIEFEDAIELYLVNENGASIYSASEVARNEFPNLDLTVRGAISIGRRLIDPLSELVKIDPKSIGVGQYQHDVHQGKLKENLTICVEHCVNAVGVDLNTASEYLLSYISGLGPVLAKNVVQHRSENGSFQDIKTLLKVSRIGAKSFEQCAGFLRVRNGKNILDNTGVHPERYSLVDKISRDQGLKTKHLVSNPEALKKVDLQKYIDDQTGLPTLKDIIAELTKPGFDIRGKAQSFEFTPGINSIEDLNPGMYVIGIINNITKFGAFVDIGIKEAGLIHVSQIANKFIKDPLEVVQLNQKVNAKIIEVDIERKRISLSLKS